MVKATPSAGQLRLEITADFSNNPLLETRTAAQEAIAKILTLHSNEGSTTVGAATGFTFQPAAQVDPTCPLQPPEEPDAPAHRFVIGITTEPVSAANVTLSVPTGNPNDVILWTDPNVGPSQKVMLIAGDQSPPIAIPTAPVKTRPFPIWIWGVVTTAYVALRYWMIRSRRKRP